MDSKIKVLIADCDKEFRDTLQRVLEDCQPIEVVGCALEREELLRLIGDRQPDIVIVDMMLPPLDGLSAIREINKQGFRKRPSVYVMSKFSSEESLREAVDLGVSEAPSNTLRTDSGSKSDAEAGGFPEVSTPSEEKV